MVARRGRLRCLAICAADLEVRLVLPVWASSTVHHAVVLGSTPLWLQGIEVELVRYDKGPCGIHGPYEQDTGTYR